MKRLLVLTPLLLVLAGCNDRDETDVKLNAAVAFASAREALGTAWNSVAAEASKVTANSSKAALEQAKKQTAHLQAELSKIEIKNPLTEAQMSAAKEQMAKIQAALTLKNLQAESESAVQNAIATGKIAQQKYEDASKQLAQLDESYRDLKTRLDSAQTMYDNASSALNGAMAKVQELAGQK
jgi:chromosome segregation ATPase